MQGSVCGFKINKTLSVINLIFKIKIHDEK